MRPKITIEKCKQIALERGGKCLSDVYVNRTTKLEWECKHGHTWFTTPSSVFVSESWCPNCNINMGEQLSKVILEKFLDVEFTKCRPAFLDGLELDGYNDDLSIAFEFQGVQHYKLEPHFHRTPDAFENQLKRDAKKVELCKDRISLLIIPYTKYNEGVYVLADYIRSELIKLGYEIVITDYQIDEQEIKQIAFESWPGGIEQLKKLNDVLTEKGYILIDKVYAGLRLHKYKILCDKEHIYETTGDVILDKRGRSCPHPDCNGKPIISNEVISQYARMRGFTFNGNYDGKSYSLLPFKCILGHDVNMTWDNFKQFKNCSSCFGATSPITKYKAIEAYVDRKQGKLITTNYKNNKTPLKVICLNEHVFEITGYNLIRDKWCPECL